MPAKKLPPTSWIAARRDEGMTWDQIRELGNEEWDVDATTSAYNLAYLRSGGDTVQPRYRDEIPWRVDMEHKNSHDVQMLRFAARRKHGNSLNVREARLLDAWLARIEEADAVVHYDPRHGFVWVARRPDIDTGLIRQPAKLQRGTTLDGPS